MMMQMPVDQYYLNMLWSIIVTVMYMSLIIVTINFEENEMARLKWFKSRFNENVQEGYLGGWVVFTIHYSKDDNQNRYRLWCELPGIYLHMSVYDREDTAKTEAERLLKAWLFKAQIKEVEA